MSVDIVDKETLLSLKTTTDNFTSFYEEMAGMLRVSDLQNVTFLVISQKENREILFFRIESIFPENITGAVSIKDLLELSTESRQNLANSAAKLINMVYTNQSRIYLNNDNMILTVDNTSVSYKATLDQCKAGYQLHRNGIVCGKR